MRKSSVRKTNYRPGTWRRAGNLVTFHDQMADYARGEVLVQLRRAKGKSREDAAVEIGVTAKTMWAWEKRDAAIKPENARAVAEYYGVEVDSIVTRDPADGPLPLIGATAQLASIEAKLDLLLERLGYGSESGPDTLRADISHLDQRLNEVSRRLPSSRRKAG